MSRLGHIAAAACYAAIAVAVAALLPRFAPGTGAPEAFVAGVMVVLVAALAHEVLARREAEARLVEDVGDLRLSQGRVLGEIARAREEAGRIFEAITAAGGRRPSRALEDEVDRVVAEVRVLQSLVDQLTERLESAAAPPRPGGRPQLTVIAGEAGPSEKAETEGATLLHDIAPVAHGLDDDTILALIREGLRQDRVQLVLQPIVTLPQRRHKFYEAFTRIRTDDGAVIVPEQYVALAEREGLIAAIDNLLLFRCIQLLRRARRRNENLGFFCNVSPHTLADRKFFREFVEFMADNVELAPNLVFEFPQATVAARDEETERQLRFLATLGFRFSMDQVASLRIDCGDLVLRHFRFVKIEAAALLSDTAPGAELEPRDLKRLMDRHGIDLIAEKIESEHTLLELLDFDIDFGQGYLFGEPRLARTG